MNEDKSDRAVSPAVAVILMVGISVILSATIGLVILDLGQATTESSSGATLGVRVAYHDDATASVQVVTGTADELRFLVDGEPANTESRLSNPRPGDTATVSASPDSTITVVAVHGDDASVVLTKHGRGGAVNTGGESPVSPTPTPTPTPIPDSNTVSLVTHYTMDESDVSADGTTLTDAAGVADATINGPTLTEGVAGDSFQFDGTDDSVSIPDGTFNMMREGDFSYSFWFKTTKEDARGTLFFPNGDADTRVYTNYGGTGHVGFQQYDGDGKVVASTDPVTDGNWHYFVGTYDSESNTMTLYIDGEFNGQTTQGTPNSVSRGNFIGVDNHQRWFAGQIDELKVYKGTLSDEYVSSNYAATAP